MITFLFSFCLCLSSVLIFVNELFVGKLLLPLYGGSSAVWTSSLFFFQACLFTGYLLACFLRYFLAERFQFLAVVVGLLLAICVLPIQLSTTPDPGTGGLDTVVSILWQLTVSIGLPFLMLSTLSPIAQHWYHWYSEGKGSPYFLYSASNIGSICGLLVFPFYIERFYSLASTNSIWSSSFVGLAAIIAVLCVIISARGSRASSYRSAGFSMPPLNQVLHWIFASALPSSLLLGISGVLTQNIAPFPLLWVGPLVLYFLSFVLAFSGVGQHRFRVLRRLTLVPILLVLLCTVFPIKNQVQLLLVLHATAFFMSCVTCNVSLYITRPPSTSLTIFYLSIAFGGALGGLFNAVIAPQLFASYIETDLAYLAVMLVSGWYCISKDSAKVLTLRTFVVLSGVLVALVGVALYFSPSRWLLLGFVAPLFVLLYSQDSRPRMQFVGLMVCFLVFTSLSTTNDAVLHRARNFYGVVSISKQGSDGSKVIQMHHGDTVHGAELESKRDACFSTTYYHAESPVGKLLDAVGDSTKDVLMIGLGTGSIVCLGKNHQSWSIVEINPLVTALANDERYFTFLKSHSLEQLKIITGDGRLVAEGMEQVSQDLVIVDAFSADSIPVHLLTAEAVEAYFKLLRPKGILLFHISNRYLDLVPVVSNVGASEGLHALRSPNYSPSEKQKKEAMFASSWVMLVRPGETPAQAKSWKLVTGEVQKAWTDNYSSIVSHIVW